MQNTGTPAKKMFLTCLSDLPIMPPMSEKESLLTNVQNLTLWKFWMFVSPAVLFGFLRRPLCHCSRQLEEGTTSHSRDQAFDTPRSVPAADDYHHAFLYNAADFGGEVSEQVSIECFLFTDTRARIMDVVLLFYYCDVKHVLQRKSKDSTPFIK